MQGTMLNLHFICYVYTEVKTAIIICYCKFGNFCEVFIFAKIKSLRNVEINLLFTYEGKSCHSREFLRRKSMSFNAIHENIIFLKISKTTVC